MSEHKLCLRRYFQQFIIGHKSIVQIDLSYFSVYIHGLIIKCNTYRKCAFLTDKSHILYQLILSILYLLPTKIDYGQYLLFNDHCTCRIGNC